MKSKLEDIYLKSPVIVQNLILSLFGLKLQYIRYGWRSWHKTVQANSYLKFTEEQLHTYVKTRLTELITNSAKHVPFYRNLFKDCGFHPDKIISINELNKLPLLEKKHLRENFLQFINEKYNRAQLLCIHTTGTTGTPLNIYCNKGTCRLNYAYYDRFLVLNGIPPKGKRVTFGGRIIVPIEQKKPPFWRYSWFQKNILFSSYHLTEQNIPYYIDKLKNLKPDYIDAYPSSIYTIARFACKQKINLKNITQKITTSAETLLPEQRELIETAFGVPIVDQYGAAEMCVFVGQCKEGSYHIHSDYAFVEFIREDGTVADPGEEAEIVCTGLINPVMPLIRYRIGDKGVLSDKKCKCGSHFPVMEKILGRIDDFILTSDGRKVGRLSPVLKGFPVKEAQYVQNDIQSVDVIIVKDRGYEKNTDKEIIAELRKRLGYEISINIKYADYIRRGTGGKLKTVVSNLNKREDFKNIQN